MSRTRYTPDLHFKQKCEYNMYKDIVECLICMLLGKEVQMDKLKIHLDILNYLLSSEVIESNEYDNLAETLTTVIKFFTP